MMYRGAGIVLFHKANDGTISVLLGKRAFNPFKGTWTIFGGGIERNENSWEAAFRELKEELFIKKSSLKNRSLKLKKMPFRFKKIIPFLFEYTTYFVETNIKFTKQMMSRYPEFIKVAWVDINNLSLQLHPSLKESLEYFKNNFKNDFTD